MNQEIEALSLNCCERPEDTMVVDVMCDNTLMLTAENVDIELCINLTLADTIALRDYLDKVLSV